MLFFAAERRPRAEGIPACVRVREYVNLCYILSSRLRLVSTRDIFTTGNHYDRYSKTRLVSDRRSSQAQAMSPSAAIVGAGAIGAWIGDALDRAGWGVSMLARGPTLAALRSGGLTVERGGETRHSRPRARAPAGLGNQSA